MSAAAHFDVDLLHALLGADGPQTVHALARATGLDALVVWPKLDQLRRAGCEIASHPQHGVCLVRAGLECWADYLEHRRPDSIGRRALVYRQTTSTQDLAHQLVQGAADPTSLDGRVVVADHQTAGRGRLGRAWFAEPGTSLLFTAVVHRRDHSVDHLMLAACEAVAVAVDRVCGRVTQVRWPNDILLGRAKVAGILLQVVNGSALVGVGINVSADPPKLTARAGLPATSLAAHGCTVDRLVLLDVLCETLDRALWRTGSAALAEAWRSRSTLRQQRVTVDIGGRRLVGRVIDVDPEHGLLLQVERGPVVTLPAATTSLIHEPGCARDDLI